MSDDKGKDGKKLGERLPGDWMDQVARAVARGRSSPGPDNWIANAEANTRLRAELGSGRVPFFLPDQMERAPSLSPEPVAPSVNQRIVASALLEELQRKEPEMASRIFKDLYLSERDCYDRRVIEYRLEWRRPSSRAIGYVKLVSYENLAMVRDSRMLLEDVGQGLIEMLLYGAGSTLAEVYQGTRPVLLTELMPNVSVQKPQATEPALAPSMRRLRVGEE